MRAPAALLVCILSVMGGACAGGEESDVPVGVPGDSTEVVPVQMDYEVILVGAMPDTLRGPAHAGDVVDAQSGQTVAVIRLDTGFDFGGGFFLTYGDAQLPAPGVYTVEPFPADSIRDAGLPVSFSARYRRGLLINLRATEGTVRLDEVSDSLVAGSFDISLTGLLALPGGAPREGSVRALGEFRAHTTGAGYIIGF